MFPVNLQNEEKLAYYAVSPAHGRGGSQDEVKLAYYYLCPGLLVPIVYCVKFWLEIELTKRSCMLPKIISLKTMLKYESNNIIFIDMH